MNRLARWALYACAGLLLFLALLWPLLPLIAASIIRHEIQSAVAGSLNATVEIDDISYAPLLSVRIGHARLMTPGPDGTPIAEMSGLKVSLASIPWSGPIVVNYFELIDPVILLTRSASGEIELQQNLLRPQPPSGGSSGKLSSSIEVRHLAIDDLTLQVRDWNRAAPPQVWAHLDVRADLATEPGSYAFHVSLVDKPLANLSLDGSADVDGVTAKLDNFSATAQVPAGAALSSLPPEIAAICRQYGLAGCGVAVSVASGATATVDAGTGRWKMQGLRGDVTLTSRPDVPLAGGRLLFDIAGGGPSASSPIGAEYLAELDPDTRVLIYVDPKETVEFHSAGLPQPITNGVGALDFSNGTLALKAVDLHYGSHEIQLQGAAQLHPDRLELHGLRLDAAGGAVLVDSAEIGLAPPHNYSATLAYAGIQLRDVAEMARINDPGGHLSGQGSGDLSVEGSLPPTGLSPLLAAEGGGRFKIDNGDFFDIPVIGDVAGRVSPGFEKAGRIGQAAGIFTVAGGTVNFSKLAVSSPLLGIQGGGNVGLMPDNQLDLNLIAVPFTGLKKQVNQIGIPLLGQVVGGIQNAFNKVEGALYSFHVTGPAANPTIKPVPVPALSAASKNVFGQMLGNQGAGGLLDLLQPNKKKD